MNTGAAEADCWMEGDYYESDYGDVPVSYTHLDNNLPRPRDIASPDFVKLRNEVTDLIKWW